MRLRLEEAAETVASGLVAVEFTQQGDEPPPPEYLTVRVLASDFDESRLRSIRAAFRAGRLRVGFHLYNTEAEIDQQQPNVLEAHELEVGKDYYILLTTSAGLYRYDIHDVVRCVGFMIPM